MRREGFEPSLKPWKGLVIAKLDHRRSRPHTDLNRGHLISKTSALSKLSYVGKWSRDESNICLCHVRASGYHYPTRPFCQWVQKDLNLRKPVLETGWYGLFQYTRNRVLPLEIYGSSGHRTLVWDLPLPAGGDCPQKSGPGFEPGYIDLQSITYGQTLSSRLWAMQDLNLRSVHPRHKGYQATLIALISYIARVLNKFTYLTKIL